MNDSRSEALWIPSGRWQLEGRLDRSADNTGGKRPLIVMAHGFATELDFGLGPFVRAFTGSGFTVLRFNYRGFGESGGRPRRSVHPRRQCRDLAAAIRFGRSLPGIDPNRVFLWGSSYGGGHVLTVAARQEFAGRLSGVIAQVPFVDGGATITALGIESTRLNLPHILRDWSRAATFRPPHEVPVVAPPGRAGAMTTPESPEGYRAIVPRPDEWANRVTARSLWQLAWYRPVRTAGRITCPVLLIGGEKDSLIPAEAIDKAASRIPKAKLKKHPFGHFDIYRGTAFEAAIREQSAFLESLRSPR